MNDYKTQLNTHSSHNFGRVLHTGNLQKGFSTNQHLSSQAREAKLCTRAALGNGMFSYGLYKLMSYVVPSGLKYKPHSDPEIARHQKDFWRLVNKTERHPLYNNMGQLITGMYRTFQIDGEASSILFCNTNASVSSGNRVRDIGLIPCDYIQGVRYDASSGRMKYALSNGSMEKPTILTSDDMCFFPHLIDEHSLRGYTPLENAALGAMEYIDILNYSSRAIEISSSIVMVNKHLIDTELIQKYAEDKGVEEAMKFLTQMQEQMSHLVIPGDGGTINHFGAVNSGHAGSTELVSNDISASEFETVAMIHRQAFANFMKMTEILFGYNSSANKAVASAVIRDNIRSLLGEREIVDTMYAKMFRNYLTKVNSKAERNAKKYTDEDGLSVPISEVDVELKYAAINTLNPDEVAVLSAELRNIRKEQSLLLDRATNEEAQAYYNELQKIALTIEDMLGVG